MGRSRHGAGRGAEARQGAADAGQAVTEDHPLDTDNKHAPAFLQLAQSNSSCLKETAPGGSAGGGSNQHKRPSLG